MAVTMKYTLLGMWRRAVW